jgi:carbon-monoxide dehydrogenase medium subunit
MLLPRFEYYEPSTLGEACRLLVDLGPQGKVLSGGTDLLVNMKKGLIGPSHLVSVHRIAELEPLTAANGALEIGGTVRAARLARWEALPGWAQALAEGARSLGTPLVRNRATVAGNVVTARPAADLPPPLMALGARARLVSPTGHREAPLDGFFVGPGQSRIRADEVLARLIVDSPPPWTGSAYIKLGVRRTLEIALVNVAAAITLEGRDGPIARARVVLGAVAPTPVRSPSAETSLVGERPGEALFAEAGKAAAKDARPIDDYRGSAQYRGWMVETLVRRALTLAWQRALDV